MRDFQRADPKPSLPWTSSKGHFNPRAPLRDLRECARMMGITYNQAKYLEQNALIKIRPALVVWGYDKERA